MSRAKRQVEEACGIVVGKRFPKLYHGTTLDAKRRIIDFKEGFNPARTVRGGLGTAIYLTSRRETALAYGNDYKRGCLLSVKLKEGAKLYHTIEEKLGRKAPPVGGDYAGRARANGCDGVAAYFAEQSPEFGDKPALFLLVNPDAIESYTMECPIVSDEWDARDEGLGARKWDRRTGKLTGRVRPESGVRADEAVW